MIKRILCVVATPDTRADSFSSSISRAFLDELRASQKECEIIEANLYEINFPELNFSSILKPHERDEEAEDFHRLLDQINDSEAIVFISQTIAFGLPAQLKAFVEILVATEQIEKLRNKKGFHLQIEDDTLSPIFHTDEHDLFRNFLMDWTVGMKETLTLRHHHQESGEHENILLEIIEDTRQAAREFALFID